MSKVLNCERFVLEQSGRFLSPDGTLISSPDDALAFVSIDNAVDALRRWCSSIDNGWKVGTIYKQFPLNTY